MSGIIATFDSFDQVEGAKQKAPKNLHWKSFETIPVGKVGLIPWDHSDLDDSSIGFSRGVGDSATAYNKFMGYEAISVAKGIVKEYKIPESMWGELSSITDDERAKGEVYRHCKAVRRNPNPDESTDDDGVEDES